MDIPRLSGRRLTRQRVALAIGLTIGLSLGVAGLLADRSSAEGAAGDRPQAAGLMRAQYQGSIEGDFVRGRHIAQERCAACHGADGNSTDPQFPKLAEQRLPYLYWELRAFKLDIRKSEVMSANLTPLSYTDLADVAVYYSRQERKPDRVTDIGLAANGERLFYSGMPSCAMCHGAGGSGGMPMMGMMGNNMMAMMGGSGLANAPDLNGQHASYIVSQLDRFASGERQGTVMNRMAGTLGDTDKRAIAAFLSGTP